MNAKVLMITGMHRSGTSVVAQWLHKCGLFIGDHLLGAGIGNDQGHFEDADFLSLHENLLRKHHMPSTGFVSKTLPALPEEEKDELRLMLGQKNSEHYEWGWKEPRTCLFLNEYGELLPSAFYVVLVRNYNDTVNSLIVRDYRSIRAKYQSKTGIKKLIWYLFKIKSAEQLFKKRTDKFLKVWINYYEQILEHISKLPPENYVVVNFNKLLAEDQDVFSRFTDQWNFSLHYYPFKNIYQENFLSEVNDISKYVKDKSLLEKAERLQQHLCFKYRIKV